MQKFLQKITPRTSRQWLLLAFGLNFAIAAVSILPYLIRDGGFLTIAADFDAEQLSYNMLCNNAIKSGEVLWNWRTDIGSDFVSSYSFYTLGSPFFWLSLLFPAGAFPYLVGWIYMLKYAVAGLTSFCWFRREVRPGNALIGSILYAFSGFSCINLVFYHFHDVIAFFPLLVLGLDKLEQEGKKAPFLFAVALNCLLNYYFFVGEVLFLVLYYCIRFLLCGWKDKSPADHLRRILHCFVCGVLGVGIAGILFIPSIASVLSNPRVSDHLKLGNSLFFDWPNYLQMLRALFFPAENMFNFSAGMHDNWYSIAAYLPMVGVCLVIAYLIRRRRDWLCLLLYSCVLIAACPYLNGVFVMMTTEPYRRWYYMAVFFLVLATIRVLEEPSAYPWRIGCGISLAAIAAITGYLLLHPDQIFHAKWLAVLTLIAAAGVVLLWIALGRLRGRRLAAGLTACTAVFAAVTTGFTLFTYRAAYSRTIGLEPDEIYYDVVHTGDGLSDALPYRYHFWEHYSNRGMAAYLPERNSFLSTLSSSIFELYSTLGEERHAISPEGPDGTNELLSVKYYVRNDIWPDPLYTTYSNGHEQIRVYESDSALPIGFCYDTYMTRSELEQIDPSARGYALLKAIIVPDDQVSAVADVLRPYDPAVDGECVQENKQADLDKRREACSQVFEYGTDYFYSEITTDRDQYAFFSVPYDKSWHATVNGEPVEILNTSGLMAVAVKAGTNCIRFDYSPTPLWAGIWVSVVSLGASAAYLLLGNRRKKVQKEVL